LKLGKSAPTEATKKVQASRKFAETYVEQLHASCFNSVPNPCSSLSASPWKDGIFFSYLTAVPGPLRIICNAALSSHSSTTLPGVTMNQCFLALATTFFGLAHAQDPLMYDGRRCYSRALKMVNVAIGESRQLGVIETIGSVVALCLHEVGCGAPT
jgi:hypothetical protein